MAEAEVAVEAVVEAVVEAEVQAIHATVPRRIRLRLWQYANNNRRRLGTSDTLAEQLGSRILNSYRTIRCHQWRNNHRTAGPPQRRTTHYQ